MELLVVLFLLGLLYALITTVWECFVKALKFVGMILVMPFALVLMYWRFFAWIISLAIVCYTGYCIFPMVRDSVRESQERKEREEALREAKELARRQQEQSRQEAIQKELIRQKRAEEERQEKVRKLRDKEDRLRAFAIRESPELWAGYQELGGIIEDQLMKVENLKRVLLDFDQDLSCHVGYEKAQKALEEMRKTHSEIRHKIEEAYLESCAFEAMPERGKDRENRCICEAEGIYRRYKSLSQGRDDQREEDSLK